MSFTKVKTLPILLSRLRETSGNKARKSESSIEISKMLGLVCLGYGRSSFAAPLASSQRVPGSTPGAALHLELLVTPLPLNLHKFSAEGCYTEVPAPNLIIVD